MKLTHTGHIFRFVYLLAFSFSFKQLLLYWTVIYICMLTLIHFYRLSSSSLFCCLRKKIMALFPVHSKHLLSLLWPMNKNESLHQSSSREAFWWSQTGSGSCGASEGLQQWSTRFCVGEGTKEHYHSRDILDHTLPFANASVYDYNTLQWLMITPL